MAPNAHTCTATTTTTTMMMMMMPAMMMRNRNTAQLAHLPAYLADERTNEQMTD